MSPIGSYLRDPTPTAEEALHKPIGELLGVTEVAAQELASVFGIHTIEDLAKSEEFRVARAVSDELTPDGKTAINRSVLVRNAERTPATELRAADLTVLRGVGGDRAKRIRSSLGVATLRELGAWPPAVHARELQALAGELTGRLDVDGSLASGVRVEFVTVNGKRQPAILDDDMRFSGGVAEDIVSIEVRGEHGTLLGTYPVTKPEQKGQADVVVDLVATDRVVQRRLAQVDRRRRMREQAHLMAERLVAQRAPKDGEFLSLRSSAEQVVAAVDAAAVRVLSGGRHYKHAEFTNRAFGEFAKAREQHGGKPPFTLMATIATAPGAVVANEHPIARLEQVVDHKKTLAVASPTGGTPDVGAETTDPAGAEDAAKAAGELLRSVLNDAAGLKPDELIERLKPALTLLVLARLLRSEGDVAGAIDERLKATELAGRLSDASINAAPADGPAVYDYSALRLALPSVWSNLVESEAFAALDELFKQEWESHKQDEAWDIPEEISSQLAIEGLMDYAKENDIDSQLLARLNDILPVSEAEYLRLDPASHAQIQALVADYHFHEQAPPAVGVQIRNKTYIIRVSFGSNDSTLPAVVPFYLPPGSPNSTPAFKWGKHKCVQLDGSLPGHDFMDRPDHSLHFAGQHFVVQADEYLEDDGKVFYDVGVPDIGKQTRFTDKLFVVRTATYLDHLRETISELVTAAQQSNVGENGSDGESDEDEGELDLPEAPVTSTLEAFAKMLSVNDGKSPFDVFTPRSVNFGVLLKYSQVWIPLAYQVGDLVKTLPLAPGETRKFTTKTTVKKERKQKELESSLKVIGDESADTGRSESEIVNKAHKQSRFASHADARGSVGVYSAGASVDQSSDAAKDHNRTKKSMREAVSKASQQFKDERKLEIETSESSTYEETTSGEISNPNDELPVTYLFYELQRRFLVTEQLTEIEPVVLVAAPVPTPSEVTETFLLRHDWIIRRVLLDDTFAGALDMLREPRRARQMEVETRKRAVDLQVEALTETKEQLRGTTRLRDRSLAEIKQAIDLLTAAEVGAGAADTAMSILSGGLGGLFGGGGDGIAEGLTMAAETQVEAAQTELARIERETARLRTRAEAGTNALQQAVEAYTSALRAALRTEQEILRLQVHVAENILHYMQAIWEYQILDQRYFSLHDIKVPEISGDWADNDKDLDVNLELEAGRDLASVADLDNLLGFKGNYLMFPMRDHNPLTYAMASPYLPDVLDKAELDAVLVRTGVVPDDVAQFLGQPASDDAADGLLTPADWQVVTVPSGHLHIEALPGGKPILEDFKLKHRHADVLDKLAEVWDKEADSLRKLLRLATGDLTDPETGLDNLSFKLDGGSVESD